MRVSKSHILSLPFNTMLDDVYPFKEICPSSPALEAPIHSILGDVTAGMFRSIHEIIHTPRVGYYGLHDVFVTYDGCVFSDSILAPPASNVGVGHTLAIINHYLEREYLSVRKAIGHELVCVLYGAGWVTWGHWLVDFFPRIFILEQAGININDVYWVVPKNVPNYVYFFLKNIGVELNKIILFDHKNEVLFFKKMLMVPNLVSGMVVHPKMVDYICWIKTKLKKIKKNSLSKKVYISRKHVGANRILLNRDEVEGVMKSFIQKCKQ